jgi:hypothetical protein
MRVVVELGKWIVPLALAGVAMTVPVAAQEPSGALIVSGREPDLFLLYTGDVIGYLDPCG